VSYTHERFSPWQRPSGFSVRNRSRHEKIKIFIRQDSQDFFVVSRRNNKIFIACGEKRKFLSEKRTLFLSFIWKERKNPLNPVDPV
jgi:hypothetical protein